MLAGYFKQQHTFCLFTQHWRSCIIAQSFQTSPDKSEWLGTEVDRSLIIGFIPSVLLLHLTFVKVPRFVPITSLPKRYKRQASKPKRVMSPYVSTHSFTSMWMLLVTNRKRRSRELRGRVAFILIIFSRAVPQFWPFFHGFFWGSPWITRPGIFIDFFSVLQITIIRKGLDWNPIPIGDTLGAI